MWNISSLNENVSHFLPVFSVVAPRTGCWFPRFEWPVTLLEWLPSRRWSLGSHIPEAVLFLVLCYSIHGEISRTSKFHFQPIWKNKKKRKASFFSFLFFFFFYSFFLLIGQASFLWPRICVITTSLRLKLEDTRQVPAVPTAGDGEAGEQIAWIQELGLEVVWAIWQDSGLLKNKQEGRWGKKTHQEIRSMIIESLNHLK